MFYDFGALFSRKVTTCRFIEIVFLCSAYPWWLLFSYELGAKVWAVRHKRLGNQSFSSADFRLINRRTLNRKTKRSSKRTKTKTNLFRSNKARDLYDVLRTELAGTNGCELLRSVTFSIKHLDRQPDAPVHFAHPFTVSSPFFRLFFDLLAFKDFRSIYRPSFLVFSFF